MWAEFDARFRPILRELARRMGLSPSDADEVAQETLVRFVERYREGWYERDRGRLRTWILSIARNCALDFYRARGKAGEQHGASAIAELPDETELAEIWRQEEEKVVLDTALCQLRQQMGFGEQTIQAFELVAFERVPPIEVAQRLGLSVDSVYAARSRCIKRLRALVAEIEAAYTR